LKEEYDLATKKRRLKQLLITPVFFGVLVGGWFYPVLGFFIPLCMVMGLAIAGFRGRKWCDWFCPRGSFYDSCMAPLSPKKEIPRVLKNTPFRLGALAFLMTVMGVNLVLRWPSLNKIGLFFVTLLSVTTGLGIVLALLIHPRTWCTFCPIGTLINLTSKKKYPLRIDSNLCIDCRLCHEVCPVQISPYKFKKSGIAVVEDGDCLKCNLCVAVCPKKALSR